MIQLRLFGAPTIRKDPADADGATRSVQAKRLGLLAHLAAARPYGQARPRDTLLGMFWPERDDARGRAALNQAVYALRNELGATAVVSRGEHGIMLEPGSVWCDAVAFTEALEQGELERAVDLYRAPFLEGFYLTGLGDFERWVDGERAFLAGRAAEAGWALADRAEGADEALRWAKRAVAMGPPFDERGLRHLLQLRDQRGDRSGALRDYERFSGALKSEYDAEPSPETRELVEQIRARSTINEEVSREEAGGFTDASPREPEAKRASAPESQPTFETPTANVGATPSRRPASAMAMAALGALAVVLALIVGSWATTEDIVTVEGRVIVLPFSYQGSAGHAVTASGVPYLLVANLDGTDDLRTVDAATVAAVVGADEGPMASSRADRIASGFGASLIVYGSVTEAGGRLRITAHARTRGSATDAGQVTVEGTPDELFTLADRLTTALMAEINPSAEPMFRAASRTTSSLSALAAYLTGEEHYRAGRFELAAESFTSAVRHDSTFAFAHLRLVQTSDWLEVPGIQEAGMVAAMARLERLSPSERLHIRAYQSYRAGAVDEARQIYRELLAGGGANLDAWIYLGEIAYHWGPLYGEPAADSRPMWEDVLRVDPDQAAALIHLARIAALRGSPTEFATVTDAVLAGAPSPEMAAEIDVLSAFIFEGDDRRAEVTESFSEGRRGAARSATGTLAAASPDLRGVHDFVVMAQRDVERGANISAARAMTFRAGILLATGRINWANALLDSVPAGAASLALRFRAASALVDLVSPDSTVIARIRAALAPPPGAVASVGPASVMSMYLRGAMAVRMGHADTVDAILRQFDNVANDTPLSQFTRHYALLLRAERLLVEDKPAEALATLGPPASHPGNRLPSTEQHHVARARFLRGEIYLALEQFPDALKWYRSLPAPNGADVFYRPAVELRQATILMRMGRDSEAAAHIERLEALWSQADPEAAQRLELRLAALRERS